MQTAERSAFVVMFRFSMRFLTSFATVFKPFTSFWIRKKPFVSFQKEQFVANEKKFVVNDIKQDG